jgi:hypothetical protein
MMGRQARAAVGVAALSVLLGACATVVSGTSQDVAVDTEPQGASCTFSRTADGTIGTVTPTPGKLNLARRKDPVTITCTRDGYQPTVEVVESIFTGATVGNVLLGGLIGVAVDAASGANNWYPDRVIVPMAPATFANASDRDAYFVQAADHIRTMVASDSKKILDSCNPSKREFCQIDVQRLESARDRALASIEKQRGETKVGEAPAPR